MVVFLKYKAVLFDLDGTLINSIFDLAESMNHILEKYGYKKRTLEEINSFVGNGLKNLTELSLGEKPDNFDEIYADFREYYFAHCCEKTVPYEGMRETLKKLKDRGYRLGVVTNKPDFAAKEICGVFFDGLFDIVMGEHAPLKRKPAPDMPTAVMEFLGVKKEEALYVGDSEVDILTGKNAGMDVLSVSYGFRSKDELKKAGVNIMVDKPVDIYSFLVNNCG